MSFRAKRKQAIPDGLAYQLWVKERKSLHEIPYVLRDEYNVTSLKTGKVVSVPGIERSAWMYALDHLEEAKADTVSICQQRGEIFDEELWKHEIVMKVSRFLSKRSQKMFYLKNPHLKKYIDTETQVGMPLQVNS